MIADLTPITYQPSALLQQLRINKRAMTDKPYADFFLSDLEVPLASAKMLMDGPMCREKTLGPGLEDINKLLDPSQTFPDVGYATLDGPSVYAQARIVMPGVTTEMFKWWFLWHPGEKERYTLWFPHAHIDNYVDDPSRLADESLTYEERLYGNPNTIEEYIGPSSLKLIFHFDDPTRLGLDKAALKRGGFTASASATGRVAFAPDTTFMLMFHLARDTENGLELFSRYWIGAHPELSRFQGAADAPAVMERLGMDRQAVDTLAYEMSVHDLTEFHQLARILPALHERCGSPIRAS